MDLQEFRRYVVRDDDGREVELDAEDLRAAIDRHNAANAGHKPRVVAHLHKHAGSYLAGTWFGGEGIIQAIEHETMRVPMLAIIAAGMLFIIMSARNH